ncbi:unnamed protein product [Effrenium voratum]|uniref:Uncharacterized protein n=1 Tax=Effrenium voratum TaxID=2562239 RepID=A0AA36HLA5_9DINO|nr:unnamed protein product [Effrenium voratum]CAJ1446153.1 unnamed protein product [Effrenium voratum]
MALAPPPPGAPGALRAPAPAAAAAAAARRGSKALHRPMHGAPLGFMCLTVLRRAVARRARKEAAPGVEAWRALPLEVPANMDVILRNRYNDVVLEELDDIDLSPFRTLAVVRLPIFTVPNVGQLQRLLFHVGSPQQLAVDYALQHHGGFLGVAVDIPQATYLPRGCVGVEVVEVSRKEDLVRVVLRGVSMLRIIDRVAMPGTNGVALPLMQEVLEITDLEREAGEAELAKEAQRLEELFGHCGQLQKETGIFNAGDLSAASLAELTEASRQNLAQVRLPGVDAEAQRWPVLASHAAVAAFGAQKRADFLCDPFSSLRRLRSLRQFLELMDRVLTVKLHAKMG